MSAINQMLRDLDARTTAQAPPATVVDVLRGGTRVSKSRWLLTGLGVSALALALGAAYFALGGFQSAQRPPLTSGTPIAPPAAPKFSSSAPVQRAELATPKRPITPKAKAITAKPSVAPVAAPAPAQNIEAVLRKPDAISIARNDAAAKPEIVPLAPLNAAETERPRASEVIKQAVEASPAMAAQQLLEEGNALRLEGKLEAARHKYREALQRNPASIGARARLAETMNESGETGQAIAFLKTAYSQQAEAEFAVVVGRMLANRGQRAESLIWFAQGKPALRAADHALMGALLAQEQRYAEAINAYQSALAAEPHKGGWLLGLGLAYEANAQNEAARAVYRQALEWGEFKPEVVKFLSERTR